MPKMRPDPAGGAHDAPQTPTRLGIGMSPPHSLPYSLRINLYENISSEI